MTLIEALDTFVSKVDPEWKAIHRVADKYRKRMVDAYVAGFEALRASVNVEELAAVEDIRHMPEHIDWGVFDSNMDSAYLLTGSILSDAGDQAAKYLTEQFKLTSDQITKAKIPKYRWSANERKVKLEASFNMRNPRAVQWSVDHTGELIKQVDTTTRAGVQQVITNALNYGGHPKETARQIRQMIGLTENQVKGILKYQDKLDQSGRSKARVDAMVDSQIRRKVRERALTIARTETIAASCAGQQLHWEDQLDKGFLNKQDLMKEWIVTPDDKLCPICSAMAGQKVEIDGEFDFGNKAPPRHPRCRCAIGLVERPGQELEAYAQSEQGQDWSRVDTAMARQQMTGAEANQIATQALNVIRGNWGKVEYTGVWKAADERLAKLQQEYPLKDYPVASHGDWLLERQKSWDHALNLNIADYMKEHPGVSQRVARNRTLKAMNPRPVKSDLSLAGEFFNTRIGINTESMGIYIPWEDAVVEHDEKLAQYAARVAEGKKMRALGNVAYGAEATMIHEYGHALMNDMKLWSDSEIHKYFASLSVDDIATGISSYANTCPGEFFAECFTEAHMPNPRPIAVKFMEILRRLL